MSKSSNQQRCPKCGGNLFFYQDYYGWYEQCLQCGFTCDLKVVAKDRKEATFTTLEKLEFNSNDN